MKRFLTPFLMQCGTNELATWMHVPSCKVFTDINRCPDRKSEGITENGVRNRFRKRFLTPFSVFWFFLLHQGTSDGRLRAWGERCGRPLAGWSITC